VFIELLLLIVPKVADVHVAARRSWWKHQPRGQCAVSLSLSDIFRDCLALNRDFCVKICPLMRQ